MACTVGYFGASPLTASVKTELARCIAEPPHGYATCQLRFDRLQAKLDDIDRECVISAGTSA